MCALGKRQRPAGPPHAPRPSRKRPAAVPRGSVACAHGDGPGRRVGAAGAGVAPPSPADRQRRPAGASESLTPPRAAHDRHPFRVNYASKSRTPPHAAHNRRPFRVIHASESLTPPLVGPVPMIRRPRSPSLFPPSPPPSSSSRTGVRPPASQRPGSAAAAAEEADDIFYGKRLGRAAPRQSARFPMRYHARGNLQCRFKSLASSEAFEPSPPPLSLYLARSGPCNADRGFGADTEWRQRTRIRCTVPSARTPNPLSARPGPSVCTESSVSSTPTPRPRPRRPPSPPLPPCSPPCSEACLAPSPRPRSPPP